MSPLIQVNLMVSLLGWHTIIQMGCLLKNGSSWMLSLFFFSSLYFNCSAGAINSTATIDAAVFLSTEAKISRKRDLKLNFKISKDFWRFRNSRMCLFSMKEWSSVTLGRLQGGLFYKNCSREGSGVEEVVRATASISRGPAFESTWRLGFFLFFFF